jgi:hypothetical protein
MYAALRPVIVSSCGYDLIPSPPFLTSLSLSLSLGFRPKSPNDTFYQALSRDKGSTSNGASSGFATGTFPFVLLSAIEEPQQEETGSYQGFHGGHSPHQVSFFFSSCLSHSCRLGGPLPKFVD